MTPVARHAALLATAAVVACGGTAVQTAKIGRPSEPGATPAPRVQVIPAQAWVMQGPPPNAGIAVIDTGSGRAVRYLPAGLLSADASRLYAVTPIAGGTRLMVIDPRSGVVVADAVAARGLSLPRLGPTDRPAGLSPDGRHLVLAGGNRPSSSDFVVYDTDAVGRPPLTVHLAGDFTFDGLSLGGRNLYLLENLHASTAGGGYHVRRYDLAAHRLDPTVVVDKRDGGSAMAGVAIDGVTDPPGSWQFTVYAFGAGAPFVHALNLSTATAYCIDLPASRNDEALDLLWGLAVSHDGRSVYAVNAAEGAVVQMPAASPWQPRAGSFPTPAVTRASARLPWQTIDAEAKRVVFGAAVIAPDDRTVYAVGDKGISVIDTATLTERQRLAGGRPLASLTLSADGRHLYALGADTSVVMQVDTDGSGLTPLGLVDRAVGILHVAAAR